MLKSEKHWAREKDRGSASLELKAALALLGTSTIPRAMSLDIREIRPGDQISHRNPS